MLHIDNRMDALVREQLDWYQQHGWNQERLVQTYATVLHLIDVHVETLDRGNATRQTDYLAKKTAIERLVPKNALETFMTMQAFADAINSVRSENP